MDLVFTIVIYLTLLMSMVALCYLVRESKRLTAPISQVIVIISPYVLVFGCRFNVGVDYPTYLEAYLLGTIPDVWELAFKLIIFVCFRLKLHFVFFFTICAFLQIFFVFYALRNRPVLFPYLCFTLMMGCAWLSYNNLIRQSVAVSIVFYGLCYLQRPDGLWRFLATIAVACLFHRSAVVCLPLAFLYHNGLKLFNNRTLIVVTLLAVVFIARTLDPISWFEQLIVNNHSLLSKIDIVDHYIKTYQSRPLKLKGVNYGAGYLLYIFTTIYIIGVSREVRNFYHSRYVSLLYSVFVIGAMISILFTDSQLFSRFALYLTQWDYVIGALWLYALRCSKRQDQFAILAALYVLKFVAVMYRAEENTAMFSVFWRHGFNFF